MKKTVKNNYCLRYHQPYKATNHPAYAIITVFRLI